MTNENIDKEIIYNKLKDASARKIIQALMSNTLNGRDIKEFYIDELNYALDTFERTKGYLNDINVDVEDSKYYDYMIQCHLYDIFNVAKKINYDYLEYLDNAVKHDEEVWNGTKYAPTTELATIKHYLTDDIQLTNIYEILNISKINEPFIGIDKIVRYKMTYDIFFNVGYLRTNSKHFNLTIPRTNLNITLDDIRQCRYTLTEHYNNAKLTLYLQTADNTYEKIA